MVKAKHARRRRHSNGHGHGPWKPITIEQTCELLHVSVGHFHRRIKKKLETKKPGRRLLVNAYSVDRYLSRRDAHR
jgi:excisionase family DNA binding protein